MLLAEMPRMLCDIVKDAVTRQPDMEVVAEIPDCTSLAVVASETHTDVAVVGHELSELSDEDQELLRQCSGVTVLALTKDGRKAYRFELRPERVPLAADGAGVSPQLLVDAIRAAKQGRAL